MTTDTDTEEAEIDLYPRFCRNLIGHDAVLDQINVSGEGRTHQSFLFSGPRGVGKASAAWTLAAQLLSQAPAGENLFGEAEQPAVDPAERALIEAGSHPDVLSIEPAADRASKTISIDQIRTMTPFLSHHPARGDWRVVIIDALDAVNYNGANAMLKTLEEPPARAIIILINHETRPVLPTIRSRCRMVRFSPLDFEATRAVITRLFPDAAADWCDVASVLADGAPGRALLFAESDAVDLYAETCTLLSKAHAGAGEIDDLARAWGPGGGRNLARRQAALLVFGRLLSSAARRGAQQNTGHDAGQGPTMDLEEQAISAMLGRLSGDDLATLHQDILRQLAETETLNMDAAIPLYALLARLTGHKT